MIKKIAIAALVLVAGFTSARTVRQTFGVQDADNNVTFQKSAVSYETTGQHEQEQVITVETNETLYAISANITSGEGMGLTLLNNESSDTNNSIQVGIASDVYFSDFPAGKGAVMWFDSGVTGLFFKASTTSGLFRIKTYER